MGFKLESTREYALPLQKRPTLANSFRRLTTSKFVAHRVERGGPGMPDGLDCLAVLFVDFIFVETARYCALLSMNRIKK